MTTTVSKNDMVGYVKRIGFDPNRVAALYVGLDETTATLQKQVTDHDALLDFLASQGISSDDVVKVQFWNRLLRITRYKRNRYGEYDFSVDVDNQEVNFRYEDEDHEIV